MVISQYSSHAPGDSRLRSLHPDAALDEVVVRLRSLHRGMALGSTVGRSGHVLRFLDRLKRPDNKLRNSLAEHVVKGLHNACFVRSACRNANFEKPGTENLARFSDDLRGKRKLRSRWIGRHNLETAQI